MLLIVFKGLFKAHEASRSRWRVCSVSFPVSVYWHLYNVFCLFSPWHSPERPLLPRPIGCLGPLAKQMHPTLVSQGHFCYSSPGRNCIAALELSDRGMSDRVKSPWQSRLSCSPNKPRRQWCKHWLGLQLIPLSVITVFFFKSLAKGGFCTTKVLKSKKSLLF